MVHKCEDGYWRFEKGYDKNRFKGGRVWTKLYGVTAVGAALGLVSAIIFNKVINKHLLTKEVSK